MEDQPSGYAAAGVNIDEAERSLSSVGDAIGATYNERVLSKSGSFGGLFDARFTHMTRPVLVSSIDGVGTKTKVASMTGDYSGIGKDIVHHCANDILCQGAKPLFFLDYFGCSRLDAAEFHQVVTGAAEACASLDCPLIGGETAEMPGVYHEGEIDIVGCMVGILEFDHQLPKQTIKPGNHLIGLASNGLHTNGYSLARKVLFQDAGLSVKDQLPESGLTIGEALLAPHTCYVREVLPLVEEGRILGIAHITGGGLLDNLPRALPANTQATIYRKSWEPLEIFRQIQTLGNIPDSEMFRAFNMGIGMVLVVDGDEVEGVVERLNLVGMPSAEIGKLSSGPKDVQIV